MQAQDYIIALIQAGMTQAEIAADVGLSQPTISRIATGRRAELKFSAHDRIRTLYRKRVQRQQRASKKATA